MSRNSVQDRIDNTYIEHAIFSLWKIDIIQLIKIKAAMAKEFHIQPSELDRMPMWEYELFVAEINERVKEENDAQNKESSKYDMSKYSKMMKQPDPGKFSTPKMPNIKAPKIKGF